MTREQLGFHINFTSSITFFFAFQTRPLHPTECNVPPAVKPPSRAACLTCCCPFLFFMPYLRACHVSCALSLTPPLPLFPSHASCFYVNFCQMGYKYTYLNAASSLPVDATHVLFDHRMSHHALFPFQACTQKKTRAEKGPTSIKPRVFSREDTWGQATSLPPR